MSTRPRFMVDWNTTKTYDVIYVGQEVDLHDGEVLGCTAYVSDIHPSVHRPGSYIVEFDVDRSLVHEADMGYQIDDLLSRWFYVLAHPEHAADVAREVLFGAELERDRFGHVVGGASTREGEAGASSVDVHGDVDDASVLTPPTSIVQPEVGVPSMDAAPIGPPAAEFAAGATTVTQTTGDLSSLRHTIASTLREHLLGVVGGEAPDDEFDCCADAVMDLFGLNTVAVSTVPPGDHARPRRGARR